MRRQALGLAVLCVLLGAPARAGAADPSGAAAAKEAAGEGVVDGGILGTRPASRARPAAEAAAGGAGMALQLVLAFGAIAAVLGGVLWALKRFSPGGIAASNSRLVEVLARTPVGPKQAVVLLRVGPRIVLLGVTPDAIQPITEIHDAAEVERLAFRTEPPARTGAGFGSLLAGMMASVRPTPLGEFEPPEAVETRVRQEIDVLKRKLMSWEEEGEAPRAPVEGTRDGGLAR